MGDAIRDIDPKLDPEGAEAELQEVLERCRTELPATVLSSLAVAEELYRKAAESDGTADDIELVAELGPDPGASAIAARKCRDQAELLRAEADRKVAEAQHHLAGLRLLEGAAAAPRRPGTLLLTERQVARHGRRSRQFIDGNKRFCERRHRGDSYVIPASAASAPRTRPRESRPRTQQRASRANPTRAGPDDDPEPDPAPFLTRPSRVNRVLRDFLRGRGS
jgi:hypothetical protein